MDLENLLQGAGTKSRVTRILRPMFQLKVGDEAKFRVSSTCPCNFTMHYEVVSRGNIVHSGVHTARLVKKRSPGPKIRFLTKESDGKGNKVSFFCCRLNLTENQTESN